MLPLSSRSRSGARALPEVERETEVLELSMASLCRNSCWLVQVEAEALKSG